MMDSNIAQTVYDTLTDATNGIRATVDELNTLEAQIKSHRYTEAALQAEILPQRSALKQKIADDCQSATARAKALVDQYRTDAAALDTLDPADITDDIKLLQSGVTLLPRDIQAILDRNSGNRTMTQLALRYAEEHKIDMQGVRYIGGNRERQTADALDTMIHYYSKWIDKDNALAMLDRFFKDHVNTH